MRQRILAVLAVIILALGLPVPAHAEAGNSGDNGCTSSDFTGNNLVQGNPASGSWSRDYNPNCNNNTVGYVIVSWSNYDSGGSHYIKWNASISTQGIAGNQCIFVSLDWLPPGGDHSDSQTVRNCKENSLYAPTNLPQVIRTCAGACSSWGVWRLQIGTYDPDNGAVTHVACPSSASAPSDTDTDGECTDWQVPTGPSWSNKSAKIYRRDNAGNTDQNLPKYPADYNLATQVDPNN